MIPKNETGKKLSLIAAVSKNGVIGRENKLPWHLPEDFKRFKEITYGAPVIMGRKTYESIGRLLPGRKNIIISRDPSRLVPGGWVTRSLEDAITEAGDVGEVFVLGGGEIYRLALPLADRVYITEVDVEIEGDAFFPAWPELRNGPFTFEGHAIHLKQTQCEERPADLSAGRPPFRFLVFDRQI